MHAWMQNHLNTSTSSFLKLNRPISNQGKFISSVIVVCLMVGWWSNESSTICSSSMNPLPNSMISKLQYRWRLSSGCWKRLKASLGGILREVKWFFGVNGVFVVHPSTLFPWVDSNWCWRTFHESIVIDVDGGGYKRPTCIILFLNDHSSLSVMGHDNYCVVCYQSFSAGLLKMRTVVDEW